ncbi:MAG TPA: biopolymer transporter ExbD [Steroidobacteraceae bacterium]|nr:biopolymer transporter ExbD [Steroidobacteraceae bacterium]
MQLKPRRTEEPEINVTSLIDVVLLLVVFFMLSSNFSAEGRLRIRLPQANEQATDRAAGEALVVTVSASGAYLVNGRELINSGPDTLRAAVLKSTANTPRATSATIRADGRASHQSVVTAMDVLAHLGFTQMNVATLAEPAAGTP